ncbi:MAG: aminotransferase class I/II-fold pyridoxal phosphate-dependent enzyme [Balneolales bacterium]|nr:aminotransferase class I/II-fold pyridoxal phosphate-dependent enzyme [Balneolales bacterium]
MKFETKAIHAGLDAYETLTGSEKPLIPPVVASTVFQLPETGKQDDALLYSRLENPNRTHFERLLAHLEGGESCAAFASGMAATYAVLTALEPGSHIIFPSDMYSGHRILIREMEKRLGLMLSFVDMRYPENVQQNLCENTRLIWIETPSNPMLHITDIKAVCDIAAPLGIAVCVDNTWPSPYNQRPLSLGAGLVMHSATKYIGGHSDLTAGAIVSAKQDAFFERIRFAQQMGGAIPTPELCWHLSRSARTLAYRMTGHNKHATLVASWLENRSGVSRVWYPGLSSHPGHTTAAKQMAGGFGGMLSFEVDADRETALKLVAATCLISRATSLGGVESSWEHRRSTEGADSNTPENLIRFSVGLEHPDDLLDDLEQAFLKCGL